MITFKIFWRLRINILAYFAIMLLNSSDIIEVVVDFESI